MKVNPIHPPRFLGAPLGRAGFKQQLEDFQVEEVLGFEPSGEGEHCCLWVEKTDWNSNDVAAHFARCLGIRARLVSHCGQKDRHAVTRQWFGIHLPGEASPEPEILEAEGIRILRTARNGRKLRRGSHDGNRFVIRLRDCDGERAEIESRWAKIVETGVPNYFGPQRFGKRQDNVQQAERLFSGAYDVRDRNLRGLLISAARSYLFNAVIAERVAAGTWNRPLDGEVYGFAANRSLILPHNCRGDEPERFAEGQIELTAPLWGQGDLLSESAVFELENAIGGQHGALAAGLEQLGLRQERRVIRLKPGRPQFSWEDERDLVLRFDLPKGTFATTVLRELVDLEES